MCSPTPAAWSSRTSNGSSGSRTCPTCGSGVWSAAISKGPNRLLRTLESVTGRTLSDEERHLIVQPIEELTVVNSGLEDTMVLACHALRETMLTTDGMNDLRTAAFHAAISKVAQSYLHLGVFP